MVLPCPLCLSQTEVLRKITSLLPCFTEHLWCETFLMYVAQVNTIPLRCTNTIPLGCTCTLFGISTSQSVQSFCHKLHHSGQWWMISSNLLLVARKDKYYTRLEFLFCPICEHIERFHSRVHEVFNVMIKKGHGLICSFFDSCFIIHFGCSCLGRINGYRSIFVCCRILLQLVV